MEAQPLGRAWDKVAEHLRATAPAGGCAAGPGYVLDTAAMLAGSRADRLAGLPLLVPGATPLARLRQQRHELALERGQSGRAVAAAEPGAPSGAAADSYGWAEERLQAFSREEAPDASRLAEVWRLPGAVLAGLCERHLSLDAIGSAALAELIHAVASDAATSLENQRLVLERIAGSRVFGAEAIPAVVQSQVVALAQTHPQAAVAGLLEPLLARLSPPTAGLVAKAVKSGMPAAALAAVWGAAAAAVARSPQTADDSMLQVMEALAGAMPPEQLTPEGSRSWAAALHAAALHNRDSKKLGALMLHCVNRFGGRLGAADLDLVAAAAGALTTPLKKAVIAAANRKRRA
ncbi:hypothetical protein IWQ57_000741 [Coemansia nantahalensis]|uniref:Uncharacterized protein n=1 Tax=Coemansia nantahalensis TaxID=2789366 RepID=A0ACC1K6U4_9FUNG|nr:hypothetical protein IWQ57_000741 [Coemansia nantahalensis]